MPIERLSLRMRVALLGFAAVLLAGALAAFLMLSELQRRTDADALAGRQAMAESVAQTLAAQIARAVRVGIPLEQIPGVQEYFQHTLERTPDIASIALQMPDGRQLYAVGRQQPQAMQTTAIVVQGQAIAQVATSTRLGQARDFFRPRLLAALSVLAAALLSGWLCYLGPGRRWQMREQRLLQGMRGDQALPASDREPADALEESLQALAQARQRGQEARAATEAYAQELLAVDFDHRLQAAIADAVAAQGSGSR